MWSDATVAAEAAGTHAASSTYLAVYFLLGLAVLVAGFGSGVFITIGTVNAARATYDAFATKVRACAKVAGLGSGKDPVGAGI